MYILLTRTQKESEELSFELSKLKLKNIIDPMLDILSIADCEDKLKEIDFSEVGIVLFTSANALAQFANKCAERKIDIAVVGKKSLLKAKSLGFNNIILGGGDAKSLLTIAKSAKKGKKIIYIAGEYVTIEIADELNSLGYDAEKICVYKARYAECFSNQTIELLIAKKISGVILFSSKTAETFRKILLNSSTNFDLSSTKIFALSEKISKIVSDLGWYNVYVSNDVNQHSIIDLVKQHINEK